MEYQMVAIYIFPTACGMIEKEWNLIYATITHTWLFSDALLLILNTLGRFYEQ